MWSPPDKNALPSPEEIRTQKEAINVLENALKGGGSMPRTRLRIVEMRRELEERKGWIAPIRQVPTEILVDIMLRASEMDDMAPVMFTAVSRLWRNIILATPKAWSFIDLKRHYDIHTRQRDYDDYFSAYMTAYFERSEPRTVHLRFPNRNTFLLAHSNQIIQKLAHRIQCLIISADLFHFTRYYPECQKFPYLQTLILAREGGGAVFETSFLTISRFPALQTLRWPRCFPLMKASLRIFPPLQHLSLAIGRSSSSMNILKICAATLKTLHINCEGWTTTPNHLTFPLLRYLATMQPLWSGDRPPLVKAITPVLTSLEVTSPLSQFPAFFDAGMQKVTHMRWNTFKTPPVCPQLQVLQITVDPDFIDSITEGHADCASKLTTIAGAYPSLERIELSNEMKGRVGIRSMQQKVEECLGEGLIKPTLLWTSRLEGDFPGNVATTCGKDMPCNKW